ncbi:unnamed protein product [Scytosiphon promiscuus]
MSIAKRNSEAAAKWAAKRRESKERALFLQDRPPSSIATSRQTGDRDRRPPKNAASTSHEANAAYMHDFRKGMADMYLALEGKGSAKDSGSDEIGDVRERQTRPYLGRTACAIGGRRLNQHDRGVSERIRFGEPEKKRAGNPSREISLLAGELKKSTTDVAVACGWRDGPLDPAGQLLDLSDRNLLCASVRGDEAVFGCADHALYCVDLSHGVETRRLYGSRSKPDAGHKEWVSTVCHTSQGDIASGGVDGKLCLWPRGGGNPGEVQAHAGSISAMKADTEGRVVTSGYGGALRVWDCRRRNGGGTAGSPRMLAELADRSLPAPCMDFAWSGLRAMTGHRDGRVGVFDLETGVIVTGGGCKGGAHSGHVTSVLALGDTDEGGRGGSVTAGCFATGGQDGFVRIWDSRIGKMGGGGREGEGGPAAVLEAPAHRGPRGVGAVGGIITAGAGGNRLASFGADKRICVFEKTGSSSPPSSSLVIEHVFDDHRDFIYCMDFVHGGRRHAAASGEGSGVLVTGGGDGMLLAHDLVSMRLLYGLGCCRAGAVRCAVAGGSRLTVAGDDGNTMLYSFAAPTDG